MNTVSLKEFLTLMEHQNPFCISIYLPTDEVGLYAHKRRAQLQNLEDEVRQQLEQLDVSQAELKQIKQRVDEVKENPDIWRVEQHALAVFISPTFSKVFQLPIEVKRLVHVSSRFHLKPMLLLLTRPYHYYLLSLAKNTAELLCGDRYGLHHVDVPGMPEGYTEVVGIETERNLQFHTSTTTPAGGGRPAMFHGQSSSWKDDKHRYLERYLQQVEKAVTKYLQSTGSNDPLILAGVERMITSYQKVSTYQYLFTEECIRGNHEGKLLSELHAQALELLKPYFIQQEKEEVERVLATGGTAQFSVEIDEILKQAALGRVDTLLVAQGVREWGKFSPETLTVTRTDQHHPEYDDLLDVACALTLNQGGQAFVLPVDQLPQSSTAAAVFRY